jgi:molecular chaperone GrpE
MDSEQNMNGNNGAIDPAATTGDAPVTTDAGAPMDELSRAQAQVSEYLDLLQRERANFVNFRRRAEQERQDLQQYANAQLIKRLLPIVDDFDRALAAAPDPKANPWVEGFALIDRKLHNILEAEGVTVIDSQDQPFDPKLHEAVEYEGGEGEDVVTQELNRGYRLRERVLRPAIVRVGKRTRDA